MLKPFLILVVNGQSLSQQQAREAMEVIMSGQASEAQIGAFLTALHIRGESSAEVAGFAQVMRAHAAKVSCRSVRFIDTCGTGGDSKGSFNISTTVAFVLAAAGLPVAKHGNKGASSPTGSADVLEALGINIILSPETAGRAIDEVGIGFMYAPLFHGAMKYAAKPRRELGFRTVFNLLGPLANPANAPCQLMGVYDGSLPEKMAQAMLELGVNRAMVVHSRDGMDEISTAVPTEVAELKDSQVTSYEIDPAAYGFAKASLGDYLGGNPEKNAAITLGILRGEKGPKRDIVLINAAAGLVVGSVAEDLNAGIALAAAALDSGAALAKLEALRTFSQAAGEGTLSK